MDRPVVPGQVPAPLWVQAPDYPASDYPASDYPASDYPAAMYQAAMYQAAMYQAPMGDVPPGRRRSRGARVGFGLVAAVVALGAAGVAADAAVRFLTAPAASSTQVLGRPSWPAAGAQGAGAWSGWGSVNPGRGSWPGSGGGLGGSQTGSVLASTVQQVGVVDIDTVLGGQGARAAGTGMILTSRGEVLTNKHVVDGETSMTVTVVATGRTYAAHVVGTVPTDDVAVIQMDGASGLHPVTTSSNPVSVGDPVVGVGNAQGVGGTPSAAPGQVTALDQSITATSEDGSSPEQLQGLIETDAPIAPGDSGGPLYNSSDQVVGMDTAASARGPADGFSIPIATALGDARKIESGSAGSAAGSSSAGQSAYLGVEVENGYGGALVAGVVDGSPAASAGLAAGDVITAVDGRPIQSITDLSSVMATLAPGRQVVVTWTDPYGQDQQAHVTLAGTPTT